MTSDTKPKTPKKPKKTKKPKNFIKWVMIALIILVIGWFAFSKLRPNNDAPSYITATAKLGDIENKVMASGKVKALNTVDVGAQVSGEVIKLYVNVGDDANKGDLIAQIDQVTQQNALSNQQASLEQSKASLQQAKADYMSRQASMESAYADMASQEAQLKQAQSDLERLRPLVAKQAISEQQFENAQTNVNTAEARLASARAAIKTAQAAIISAESNIISSQADLQKSQTNLVTANTGLGYTTIRAPIDGTVVSVTTEQGATVNANQSAPTIVTLADLSTVRINAQISEADVINVRAGMPVYFNIIGNPDEKYNAVLKAIEPAPERISNTSSTDGAVYYIGYIEVPNPDRRFRIDMTAQIFIITDHAKNVLLVPSTAIRQGSLAADTAAGTAADTDNNSKMSSSLSQQGSQHYVRVLKEGGEVIEQIVKVGIDNRINVQVISGLQEGDEVIIGDSEDAMEADNKAAEQ